MDELRLRSRGEGQSGAMRIEPKTQRQIDEAAELNGAIGKVPMVEIVLELPTSKPQEQAYAWFVDNPIVVGSHPVAVHEHSIAHEVQ